MNSARQLEIKRMIDQLRNVGIEGFFPTPDAVIDMMLAVADMAHVRQAFSYRYWITREPHVEMLSLAFQFRPIFSPPIDSTGLSTTPITVPGHPDERECALKLVTAVEHIRDVDEMLLADAQLQAEMEGASADLLESAGYDRDRYLAWVAPSLH